MTGTEEVSYKTGLEGQEKEAVIYKDNDRRDMNRRQLII